MLTSDQHTTVQVQYEAIADPPFYYNCFNFVCNVLDETVMYDKVGDLLWYNPFAPFIRQAVLSDQ